MVLVTDTGTVIVATDQQRTVLLCTVDRGSHGRTKVVWKEHFAVPKKENSAAPRHLSTNKGTVLYTANLVYRRSHSEIHTQAHQNMRSQTTRELLRYIVAVCEGEALV
jgi:hypothetical protein